MDIFYPQQPGSEELAIDVKKCIRQSHFWHDSPSPHLDKKKHLSVARGQGWLILLSMCSSCASVFEIDLKQYWFFGLRGLPLLLFGRFSAHPRVPSKPNSHPWTWTLSLHQMITWYHFYTLTWKASFLLLLCMKQLVIETNILTEECRAPVKIRTTMNCYKAVKVNGKEATRAACDREAGLDPDLDLLIWRVSPPLASGATLNMTWCDTLGWAVTSLIGSITPEHSGEKRRATTTVRRLWSELMTCTVLLNELMGC